MEYDRLAKCDLGIVLDDANAKIEQEEIFMPTFM